MRKYNFFYNNMPISKKTFLQAVPENWESEILNGFYSYGYYRALIIDEE